jgi:hypothetical protein
MEMKADPAIRGVKFTGAIGRDVKSVGATEVDGDGGRCVNNNVPGGAQMAA